MNARTASLLCTVAVSMVGCSGPEERASASSSAKAQGASAAAASVESAPRTQGPPFRIENQRVVIPTPLEFETGSAELADASASTLDDIGQFLAAKPEITVLRVESHSSDDTESARQLTEQRALSVVRGLVARGIERKRLLAVGFGAMKPIAPNNTPAGRAANRRIEFVVAELRGHAIGGLPLDGGGNVVNESAGK